MMLAACSNAPVEDNSEIADDGGLGGSGAGGLAVVPTGGNGGAPATGGSAGGTIGTGGTVGTGGAGGDSGGTVGPVGGTGGAGGGSGGDTGGAIGPVGGQGGGGAGGVVERPAALVAAIVLTETPQVPQGTANASLTEPVELPSAPGCTAVQVDPGAQGGAPARGYDAGAITVSGLNGGNLVFQPSAGPNGTTYGLPGAVPSDLFADGAMLTAQSAGGPHLGAFSIQVAAPQAVNITEPRQQLGETHDAGDALSVRWNAGGAESLLITVLPADFPDYNPQRGTWVFCGVPDTGSFEIPAGTLTHVADNADFLGQPALVTITRTRVTVAAVGADQALITASTTQAVPVTFTP